MSNIKKYHFLFNNNLIKFVFFILKIIGISFLRLSTGIGFFSIFMKDIFISLFSKQIFFQNIRYCFFNIGFCSLPVVGLTGIFTGAVLSVQLYYSIGKLGIQDTIPSIVLIALLKELGPVLSGLMLVARVGSSMTAEIGGMVVNNQIDSLISLSVSPFRFLYIPRIIATTISMPFLAIIASLIGIIGSYIVCTKFFDFSEMYYISLVSEAFSYSDFKIGLVKSVVFGFLISIISCYKGSITEDGSVGIGRSTISAVVSCCIYILFFNFVITSIMSN
jgi:phospholipid/cholesterol/gamma-HCH transport system permease protein